MLKEEAGTRYGLGDEGDGSPRARRWDPEEIEELDGIESEVAIMAAHIHASMQPFFALIARYDRKRGWVRRGRRSCAHWLSHLIGVELSTCREYVRVARALEKLPETQAAMGRGAISYSKARALTRVAKPETEGDLLELAEGVTVSVLERMVRAWRKSDRLDEAERERLRRESRTYSIFPDDDGMYEIRGRVPAEVGALMMRTIEAAGDHLYRERSPVPALPEASARHAAKLRADAVELVYLRAAAAGFARAVAGGADDASDMNDARDAQGGRGSGHAGVPQPVSGLRAERYQVMLHVEPGTLEAEGELGMSELEDGTRASAETSRRLSCDAGVVVVTRRRGAAGHDGATRMDGARGHDGETEVERGSPELDRATSSAVLDVGRKTRTIPPALRRALEVRDRGCRFPGCGLRFTDAHHVVHWADGGETSLRNTLLLCGHHHRLVHEGGWTVEWWGPPGPRRLAAFRDPRGQLHAARAPKAPELEADPKAALVRRNRDRGVEPDAFTAGPRWEFERDIPDEVLFRAIEAALT